MTILLALLSYLVYRTEKCINALLYIYVLHSEYDVIHVCCLGTLKLYIYDVYDMIHVHVCCLGTLMPYDVYDMKRVSIFGALLCLVG